jgi:O-antigen/teichoic acid export membrane protein
MTEDSRAEETMTDLEENPATYRDAAVGVLSAPPPGFRDVEIMERGGPRGSWPAARVFNWCVQGGASILQQGLFAGAHFAVNVLLARWLSPASYGVFALAYSFYLLLLAFYMATFYDPVLIFGPGRYAAAFPQYVRTLTRAHLILLPPICLLAGLATRFFTAPNQSEIRVTLLALAVSAPLLLLVWLCRGAFYAQLQIWQGTAAGAFYLVLLVGSVWMLRRWGMLSPATALLAMAAGSLLVSAGGLSGFSRAAASDIPPSPLKLSTVVADHWRYGKWAALTAVVAWFPVNIYYTLLPARFGMQSAAVLRALMNLMYPLLHALLSLISVLVPALVKRRRQFGFEAMRRTVWRLAALFLPAGIAYLCVLVGMRDPILHFLYGDRYANQSVWVVLCIGSLPITTGIAYVLAAGLRAIENPRLVFWGYLASCATTMVLGVPLALRYGISGAAAGMVASDVPTIAVLSLCLARTTMT